MGKGSAKYYLDRLLVITTWSIRLLAIANKYYINYEQSTTSLARSA